MTHQNSPIHITINSAQYAVLVPEQSGATLKALASLPMDHVLERLTRNGEDSERLPEEILDDQEVRLADGDKFVIQAPDHHAVTVLINRQPYRFEDRHQTGRSLKERAGIPFADVLFLDRPKEDEVIPDDLQITLRSGERFHSAPPANYGHAAVEEMDVGFEYPLRQTSCRLQNLIFNQRGDNESNLFESVYRTSVSEAIFPRRPDSEIGSRRIEY